jgi:putative membrane protein
MTGPVFAHGGLSELAAAALARWTWEPVTVALLLLSSTLYGLGVRSLWRRAGAGQGLRRWEAAAFAAGILFTAIALSSPLAWLAEALFSAHMTQHEILMLVSAPLIVLGRPALAWLWALSPAARESVGGWTRRPAVSNVWHVLTGPFATFLLHGLALWIWHVPAFYEAALRSEGLHALQHFSFFATAALFWWGMIHGRYGRLGFGVGVLYVFLTALHSSILGALLTVAPSVWYPAHGARAAQWHIDALADQQVAGLLMWVPSGLVFIAFGLALLAAWLGESERRARLGSVHSQS